MNSEASRWDHHSAQSQSLHGRHSHMPPRVFYRVANRQLHRRGGFFGFFNGILFIYKQRIIALQECVDFCHISWAGFLIPIFRGRN